MRSKFCAFAYVRNLLGSALSGDGTSPHSGVIEVSCTSCCFALELAGAVAQLLLDGVALLRPHRRPRLSAACLLGFQGGLLVLQAPRCRGVKLVRMMSIAAFACGDSSTADVVYYPDF